jgi:hypothetical protein
MKRIVNSTESLSTVIGELRKTFKEIRYFTVTINTGKKRTLSQNAIVHAWFLQISRETGEYTPEDVKNLCKYHFGLPILRGEVDEEKNLTDSAIEYNSHCEAVIDPLSYENRIKAMTYYPCTSFMTTKQLNEFMEAIQNNFAGRVNLEFPESTLS